ncbi:hypothetical protein KP509_09G008300 [Ceratopteris richardii]|uniref:Uncharacterized protein n=1 Tax=Ceratopteris richardii TaxID=49495 RepID=A0A8T2U7U5_CERRI|nr:hypothetical protein KP509_09G008300 [Ceratopteris richardii]
MWPSQYRALLALSVPFVHTFPTYQDKQKDIPTGSKVRNAWRMVNVPNHWENPALSDPVLVIQLYIDMSRTSLFWSKKLPWYDIGSNHCGPTLGRLIIGLPVCISTKDEVLSYKD